jgi:hypothetical protein
MNTTIRIPDESLRIIRSGDKQLKNLTGQIEKLWERWTTGVTNHAGNFEPGVGAALVEARNVAIHEARTNTPYGKRYTGSFAAILLRFPELHKLDKSDRTKLYHVMEHLEEINAWRTKLSDSDRRRYAHPTTVWRKYQTEVTEADHTAFDDISKEPSARDRLKMLQARIRELEAERTHALWEPGATTIDQARAVRDHHDLSVLEVEELGRALIELADEMRGLVSGT